MSIFFALGSPVSTNTCVYWSIWVDSLFVIVKDYNISKCLQWLKVLLWSQVLRTSYNKALNLPIGEASLATHYTWDILNFDEVKSLCENLNE